MSGVEMSAAVFSSPWQPLAAAVALFAVLPLLALSIAIVRRRGYLAHKRLQLVLGSVLLLAVLAFEIEMRVFGWQERAFASPYFSATAKWSCPVGLSLIVHLFFAIPTTVLWVYVVAMALRRFDTIPRPNAYSSRHRFWAWLATVEMILTAVTGWLFYYLAFTA